MDLKQILLQNSIFNIYNIKVNYMNLVVRLIKSLINETMPKYVTTVLYWT